jgi:AcrR family transcriptional regulator
VTIAPPAGLRERKKQRTHAELQRAALKLFTKHGFDQVTIDDICAAAEVSKTTFYRYFDAKEDVLLGTVTEKLTVMGEALLRRPPDESAIVAVRNAFLEFAELYQVDRAQRLAINEIVSVTPALAARNLEHQAAWEGLLRDFFVSRDPEATATREPELRHYVAAATVVATLRAAVEYWLTHDAENDLPAIVDEALQVKVAAPRRTRAR